MALNRLKNWAAEVLTYSDLNAEFNNILSNPVALISPLTGNLDLDGKTITVDAAGATMFVSSASKSWDFTSGAKSGTPATTGSIANWAAQTFTDSATAGSGTAASYVAFAIQRPTLAATNATVTTTDAATFYVPNNVAAGTNQTLTNSWAIWVDAGNVRFDDDIFWRSGTAFSGLLAHNNSANRTYTFPDQDISIAIWTTGDVKLTLKTAADTGWVMMDDGTIGNAASGGTTRANADTVALFTLLWTNTVDADCAVSTGRGGSAAADYAANKTIALPKALGRALASAGAGSGLTSRALAHVVGSESLQAHTHTGTVDSDGAHTHSYNEITGSGAGGPNPYPNVSGSSTTGSGGAHTHTFTSASTGAGSAQNMQPTLFINVMVKL